MDNELSTADEIKAIEKDIRNHVQDSLTAAKAGKFPPPEWLYEDVYATADHKNDPQKYIRMPDYHKSIRN